MSYNPDQHPAQMQHLQQMQHQRLTGPPPPPPQQEPEIQTIRLKKANGGMGLSIVAAKGTFFSKVKISLVIWTTFEFSRQKHDAKILENCTFQSVLNLQ